MTVALAFESFLVSEDWIFRNSEEPEKTRLLCLGPNNKGKKFKLVIEDQLCIDLQNMFGNLMSSESIESLISCNFSDIKDSV